MDFCGDVRRDQKLRSGIFLSRNQLVDCVDAQNAGDARNVIVTLGGGRKGGQDQKKYIPTLRQRKGKAPTPSRDAVT